jgi:hypothetical protein
MAHLSPEQGVKSGWLLIGKFVSESLMHIPREPRRRYRVGSLGLYSDHKPQSQWLHA